MANIKQLIAAKQQISIPEELLLVINRLVRSTRPQDPGCPEHLRLAFEAGADAALAASIFHYDEYSIPATKEYLAAHGVAVRIAGILT